MQTATFVFQKAFLMYVCIKVGFCVVDEMYQNVTFILFVFNLESQESFADAIHQNVMLILFLFNLERKFNSVFPHLSRSHLPPSFA